MQKKKKNAILLVFHYKKDAIRPEVSSPSRSRILGGYPERDGEGRTEEILVSNIGYLSTSQIHHTVLPLYLFQTLHLFVFPQHYASVPLLNTLVHILNTTPLYHSTPAQHFLSLHLNFPLTFPKLQDNPQIFREFF